MKEFVSPPQRSHPDWPLVVANGPGVNKTVRLVAFVGRGASGRTGSGAPLPHPCS
ncbi:hypothetical protein FRUB_09516 [Fimbriiglobus ruber]|uniref:Uncharacterized protein n=1 Tax=Fimbriiglobus ruber TaxID=1908690 RepID=A0A225DG33_9BACT|nr:hypothetical protein FRUB_09516 [Fimbriiglobus ruber]